MGLEVILTTFYNGEEVKGIVPNGTFLIPKGLSALLGGEVDNIVNVGEVELKDPKEQVVKLESYGAWTGVISIYGLPDVGKTTSIKKSFPWIESLKYGIPSTEVEPVSVFTGNIPTRGGTERNVNIEVLIIPGQPQYRKRKLIVENGELQEIIKEGIPSCSSFNIVGMVFFTSYGKQEGVLGSEVNLVNSTDLWNEMFNYINGEGRILIPSLVIVNKMDLVNWSKREFYNALLRIKKEFESIIDKNVMIHNLVAMPTQFDGENNEAIYLSLDTLKKALVTVGVSGSYI